MKKLILLVMLISGVAKAQTFDFSCNENSLSIDYPYTHRVAVGCYYIPFSTTLNPNDYTFYYGSRYDFNYPIREHREFTFSRSFSSFSIDSSGSGQFWPLCFSRNPTTYHVEYKVVAIKNSNNAVVESEILYVQTYSSEALTEAAILEVEIENRIVNYSFSYDLLPHISPDPFITTIQYKIEELKPIVGWVSVENNYGTITNVDAIGYEGSFEFSCDTCSGIKEYRLSISTSPHTITQLFTINWNNN